MEKLLEREDIYIVKGLREYIFRKLDDEFLLVLYKDESPNKEVSPWCYTLNNPAALIWSFLKDTPSPKELFQRVIDYYALEDYQMIKEDIERFLVYLKGNLLISFSSSKHTACYIDVGSEVKELEIPFHSYQRPCIEPVLVDNHKYAFMQTTPSPPAKLHCPQIQCL